MGQGTVPRREAHAFNFLLVGALVLVELDAELQKECITLCRIRVRVFILA